MVLFIDKAESKALNYDIYGHKNLSSSYVTLSYKQVLKKCDHLHL